MSHQSRFDARYWMLGAGALRRPRGMVWGGRRVLDGEHEYVYLWWIHVDIWQNQYNIVVVFAIYSHESAMGVHVFPILKAPSTSLPDHPSGSSQCTSPKHPVSCIKPGLAIHFTYDNIHVSVLFSQIIPPSPSPTESKSLFFTSVSLLLSHI